MQIQTLYVWSPDSEFYKHNFFITVHFGLRFNAAAAAAAINAKNITIKLSMQSGMYGWVETVVFFLSTGTMQIHIYLRNRWGLKFLQWWKFGLSSELWYCIVWYDPSASVFWAMTL